MERSLSIRSGYVTKVTFPRVDNSLSERIVRVAMNKSANNLIVLSVTAARLRADAEPESRVVTVTMR